MLGKISGRLHPAKSGYRAQVITANEIDEYIPIIDRDHTKKARSQHQFRSI